MNVLLTPGDTLSLEYQPALPDAKLPIDVANGTRMDLAVALAAHGFNRGAEIGVEQGEFSEVLLTANPKLRLCCVDAWRHYPGYRDHVSQEKLDGFYSSTLARLARFPGADVVRMFSLDAASAFEDKSLDFVYIDANHSLPQVIADLNAWVPKVRSGGVVAGHDFRRLKGKGEYHVKEAVTAWTSAYHVRPWYVLRGDRSPTWFWVKP